LTWRRRHVCSGRRRSAGTSNDGRIRPPGVHEGRASDLHDLTREYWATASFSGWNGPDVNAIYKQPPASSENAWPMSNVDVTVLLRSFIAAASITSSKAPPLYGYAAHSTSCTRSRRYR